LCNIGSDLSAQCITVDPSHTYDANFENSDDNWTTGGVASDWTWGMPQKTFINGTLLQNKCWVTGPLTADGYNSNEASWVQSPCLEISKLQHPYIEFKVIWQSEFEQDGATIQYSTDNGVSWQTLGDINEMRNCLNSTWFNTNSIQTLNFTNKEGWSGNNTDGHGTPDWVTCNHTLPSLKGVGNIIFRFFFVSGSTHHIYDGFGFDNFSVKEAPQNNADFKYTCSAANTFQFTDNSLPCPTNYLWNFDDVNSGSDNTSTEKNPIHTFSTTGAHKVSLSISGPDNAPSSVTKTITNITATVAQTNAIKCFGDSTASATVSIDQQDNYNYVWNTMPPQNTATATNLGAGNYTVEIGGDNICTVTQNITIAQPRQLTANASVTNATCISTNGSIVLQTSGGTSPYSYMWTDGTNSNAHADLKQGTYTVKINDAHNCELDTSITINAVNSLKVSLGKDTAICSGETLLLSPGSYAGYKWQDGSTRSTFLVQNEGTYYVTVNDDQYCTASDTINIYQDCGGVYFPSAFTPNGDGLNDDFGVIGSISLISNYTLKVFNRWGNVVFSTSDPVIRWKGNINDQHSATETYTWFAQFDYNNKTYQRKGTTTVIY
jgi:gliding motility-associated-like protein